MLPWWLQCDTARDGMRRWTRACLGRWWDLLHRLPARHEMQEGKKSVALVILSSCSAESPIYVDAEFNFNPQQLWWDYVNEKTWLREQLYSRFLWNILCIPSSSISHQKRHLKYTIVTNTSNLNNWPTYSVYLVLMMHLTHHRSLAKSGCERC